MPKSLISKLTTGPKLNDLQKYIALNKNIYALPKDSQLIYLPDLIKFFPWELPSAVFGNPFTKTDLTNFYVSQLKAYHELFQNLIKHAIKLKQDNLESSYNISNQTINDLLKVARQLILSSYQKY